MGMGVGTVWIWTEQDEREGPGEVTIRRFISVGISEAMVVVFVGGGEEIDGGIVNKGGEIEVVGRCLLKMIVTFKGIKIKTPIFLMIFKFYLYL